MADVVQLFPELEIEELVLIGRFVSDMTDEQGSQFAAVYRAKRHNDLTMVALWFPSVIGIAGLHRFYAGQIGMGLIYLFTMGFCFVGTLIDAFRSTTLTYNYNYELAKATAAMITGRK